MLTFTSDLYSTHTNATHFGLIQTSAASSWLTNDKHDTSSLSLKAGFTLIQPQSRGCLCCYSSLQQIPRPPLKTSATDFTWRQTLNEYGSMHFNIMPHFICSHHFASEKTSGTTLKNISVESLPELAPIAARPASAHCVTVQGGQVQHHSLSYLGAQTCHIIAM